ncbi:2OG-Fe(II) oxygenase [Peredibacter starrii]|uniref:2OG-Fe(II) oxygenase n=1 Tax=Peredibacter starrii TaxID=28202 RepID=A0AAX4HNH6_9BACT|nr:2OG-Fe(II) oxygenase [Peredibacter starrii]WPU64855.1 2OG-Fe(II) oxygenase [Peredibacter starrii]
MIEQIIQEIEGKGWSHRTGVIGPTELAEIKDFFDHRRSEFVPAKVGKGENLQRAENIRGDYTFWIDPHEPPATFRHLVHFLTELKEALNGHFFLGLKDFECHLAYYPPGTYYTKHSDRHGLESSRVLSFIFYLHDEWNENDGGELVIYDKDDSILETVKPVPGSFICFLSEKFPHEVKPAKRERRSFTGWMHRKILY